jgi:hypothetical protein
MYLKTATAKEKMEHSTNGYSRSVLVIFEREGGIGLFQTWAEDCPIPYMANL